VRPASQQRRGGGHAAAYSGRARCNRACASWADHPSSSPNSILVHPPSSEGQHKCERSEALVGGDRRRTARATTADYFLWRAKGAALSFATGRRAIPSGGDQPSSSSNSILVHPPSSEGQHKCERSEALVGGDCRRTARATTADYLLWRAKGAALSFATGRRAIPSGGDQPSP